MRVMVFVKATAESEAGILPPGDLLVAMGRFNQELIDAGIMQGGDGLKPSSAGKRVAFDGPNRMVIDGPFAETKEQLLGFFIVECATLDEAIATARELAAANPGGAYELRPIALYRPAGGPT